MSILEISPGQLTGRVDSIGTGWRQRDQWGGYCNGPSKGWWSLNKGSDSTWLWLCVIVSAGRRRKERLPWNCIPHTGDSLPNAGGHSLLRNIVQRTELPPTKCWAHMLIRTGVYNSLCLPQCSQPGPFDIPPVRYISPVRKHLLVSVFRVTQFRPKKKKSWITNYF